MKTRITTSNHLSGAVLPRHSLLRQGLLVCGIVSSLIYIAATLLGAMAWEGYELRAQNRQAAAPEATT